ncbi:MAG: chromate transporter [Sedimentisphaerales bacterium]|nr:chromate transporter [Sedimentisphaerales bacterium]
MNAHDSPRKNDSSITDQQACPGEGLSLSRRVLEVAALFLRLGLTAFGGPAAHIAMMHDEVVKRRKWLDDEHYLNLLGATQFIPGPNSTEMAIHIGFVRAGWTGLIVGGVCFALPAICIVTALAWAYVRYESLPQIGSLLYGVKPVILIIIAQALWLLGRKAIRDALTAIVGAGVIVLYFVGINEILLLFAGGAVIMFGRNLGHGGSKVKGFVPLLGLSLPAAGTIPFQLSTLFLTFLKIGSVWYGSGYVLLAFLQSDFVDRLGWLSSQQLMDAIAIGQVTPGPLFTTATFIGYVLGGVKGAVLATLGIFLPSFVFVAISNPLIPKLRSSRWAGALLDGVTVASLGLMAAVTLQLGRQFLFDVQSLIVAGISFVLLIRYKINSTWLILGAAALGLLSRQ